MNRQRILLALASVSALGVLALIAYFVREPGRAFAGDARESALPTGRGASNLALDETRDEAQRAREDRAPAEAARADRSATAALDGDGLRITLIAGTDRHAVAGASAWVWNTPGDETDFDVESERWIGPDLEGFIAGKGQLYTADERGEFDLPAVSGARVVIARGEEVFGLIQLYPGQRGLLEMLLEPQHELVARVVDSNGNAQPGAQVELGYCGSSGTFWAARANERGEVRCRGLDAWMNVVGYDRAAPFAVRVAMPCDPTVEEWVVLDRLPKEPIVLTLPATGNVRVTIVDEAHQKLPISGILRVQSGGNSRVGRARASEEVGGSAPIENGVAILRRVGLNLDLVVEADLLGTGDASTLAKGPSNAGETVAIELLFPSDHTLLRGRVVDDRGRALANTTFDWSRLVDDGAHIVASGRNTITTDAEGRFTWTLRRSTSVHELESTPARRGFLCEVSTSARRRAAVIDFQNEVTSGLYDLGDVVVAERGPLACGRVIDPEGRGVEGVVVRACIQDADLSMNPAETYDPSTTNAEGEFAIFGPCLGFDFFLTAESSDGVAAEPTRFACARGDSKVEIKMRRLGKLTGTALVDHDWSGEGLQIAFTPEEKDATAAYLDCWRAGDRACFAADALPPGRGRVTFHLDDLSHPAFLTIDGVEIAAGARTRDPRLYDVDLRGKLPKAGPHAPSTALTELEVFDSRGRSVRGGFVWMWAQDFSSYDEQTWAGGRVRVASEETRILEIWAPGHRSRLAHPPHAAGRIVLAPEFEVSLSFDVPRELRDAALSISGYVGFVQDVRSESAPIPAVLERLTNFQVASNGRAELRLPSSGTFQLSVYVTGHTQSGDIDGYELPLTSPTIVVREADGEQRFEMRFDAAALEQCLVDIGLRPKPR
jgi:hypothetical protein